MARRILIFFVAVACAAAFSAQAGFAQESAPQPKQSDFKGSWGSAFRIRHEYWKNWRDMDNDQLDNRNFFRVKSSLWGKLDYREDISLYAKLTNEFKPYAYFASSTGSVPDKFATKKGYHFDINEVVFDNLYLDIRNVLDLPLDLRIGRQDFLGAYGEGLLIMDGTPQDGSRTYYFNAVKIGLKVNDENTVDAIYLADPRDEEILPVINRRRLINVNGNRNEDKRVSLLNTTDEQGGILYWKNKSIEGLSLEEYYIFKYEAEEGGTGLQAQKGLINTFGSYAKYTRGGWGVRAQLASQFGDYGDNDREGLGGFVYFDRECAQRAWKPKATVGYIYLSGDKRSTAKNEAWDPLFARYPWFSEIYVNSMASETGIAGYWTNMQAYRAELSVNPTAKLKLCGGYSYLRANAQVAPSAIFSGTNKNRGQVLMGKVEYAFNKNVSAYLLGEYLIPGKFYKDQDPAIFLREEISIKF